MKTGFWRAAGLFTAAALGREAEGSHVGDYAWSNGGADKGVDIAVRAGLDETIIFAK